MWWHKSYKAELKAIEKVLKSGVLSGYRASPEAERGGTMVRKFEDDFASYLGVRHALAFNSATSALHTAVLALDLGEWQNVTTTPLTFSASASCARMAGASVWFSDVETLTFGLASWKIPRMGDALIPVHLFGCPVPDLALFKFKNPRIRIIEDCSQAIGAMYKGRPVGTLGDCGIFSFNQHKQLNTGEGGMLVTNDEEIAEKAMLIRNHGETRSYILGYNYRMTEITAAIGIERLKKLDRDITQRQRLAEIISSYIRRIHGVRTPHEIDDTRHSWYAYAVVVNEQECGISRDHFQNKLLMNGIYFGKGGLKPLHLIPYYGGHRGQFPVAEKLYDTMMFTNIFKPPMTEREAMRIGKEIVCIAQSK